MYALYVPALEPCRGSSDLDGQGLSLFVSLSLHLHPSLYLTFATGWIARLTEFLSLSAGSQQVKIDFDYRRDSV